jgi:hypothetical protein
VSERVSHTVTKLSFKAFTTVMFQVDVVWIMTPCKVVLGYWSFIGPYRLHLLGCEAVSVVLEYQNSIGPCYLHLLDCDAM